MQNNPTDDDIKNDGSSSNLQADGTIVKSADEGLEDEAQFEEPIAPPSVLGEESSSGSATESESMDIDEELTKIGRSSHNSDE